MCNIIKILTTGLFLNLVCFCSMDVNAMQSYQQYDTQPSTTIYNIQHGINTLINKCNTAITQVKQLDYLYEGDPVLKQSTDNMDAEVKNLQAILNTLSAIQNCKISMNLQIQNGINNDVISNEDSKVKELKEAIKDI